MMSSTLASERSLGMADPGTPTLRASCDSCWYADAQNAAASSLLPMVRLQASLHEWVTSLGLFDIMSWEGNPLHVIRRRTKHHPAHCSSRSRMLPPISGSRPLAELSIDAEPLRDCGYAAMVATTGKSSQHRDEATIDAAPSLARRGCNKPVCNAQDCNRCWLFARLATLS